MPGAAPEGAVGATGVGALARDGVRVADRLRAMTAGRLQRATPSGAPLQAEVAGLARVVVDLAAGVAARDATLPPVRRPLPALPVLASGDLLGLALGELAGQAAGLPGRTPVWDGAERRALQACLAEVAAGLAAVREAL